jgi:hypothetical protein
MTNPTPGSLKAFNDKFNKNTHLDGYGAGTSMAMPCPGCAEPDFLKYEILNTEEAMAKGAICQHCGRGFKAVFTKTKNMTSFKIVQTCGDDLPAYQPAIKRLS